MNFSIASGLLPKVNQKASELFCPQEKELPYIFDISATSTFCVVSGSNHELHSWNYNNDSLSFNGKLAFHTDTVTKLKIHKDHLLISSSKDGRIAIWDLRVPNSEPVQVLQAGKREPLLSFDVNNLDTILAAGTELFNEDAKIIFWDLRNSSIMSQFVESHNDDITQIQFHPTSPSQLISGSVDGLICSFDLKNFDEDNELSGVINSSSSISKAGYFGSDGEYVYCLTHTETFSLWGASECNLLCDFGDVRQSSVPIDYAIDCQFDSSTNRLFLFTGSQTGVLGVLHVAVNELQLCQTLSGGHSEIIRSVFWNPKTNIFLTGGEDAKLCLWGP
ncbi:17870_t:CDS:2 [Acaulospora morrowiae]|uniref:17870_t:CDS:1 n=1 Tax=Acaulospora morrowiae TaxID=94023 RepID=A0A9N8YP86_9GLOM|nr:17870_t:CDS:2 [Acaulospora morrowiae]